MFALIFCRATCSFTFLNFTVWVRFHSILHFALSVTLVQFSDLIPSFFFLCIFWILLAVMEHRR